jgi:hypothetical protein
VSATIVARSEASFTVQVEIPYSPSMLDFEQTIQERLNQAGVVATQEALQRFDTDGSSIVVGSVKFTSKGQLPKGYHRQLEIRYRPAPQPLNSPGFRRIST